jgi:hypothetical protein
MAWIVLGVSVAAGVYCFMGYAMAGSFLAAAATHQPRLRMAATAYLAGAALCLLLALTAAVILVRFARAR